MKKKEFFSHRAGKVLFWQLSDVRAFLSLMLLNMKIDLHKHDAFKKNARLTGEIVRVFISSFLNTSVLPCGGGVCLFFFHSWQSIRKILINQNSLRWRANEKRQEREKASHPHLSSQTLSILCNSQGTISATLQEDPMGGTMASEHWGPRDVT